MDISNLVLEYIMKDTSVLFSQVPNVPINVCHILFLTFEHCKNSQKIYSSYYKSVTEILELFRKTQEVHARFLRFLDTHIYFDFLSDNEIVACKEILEIIIQISRALSGVNMKSMADNWKGFITLIQKISGAPSMRSFNLSPALQTLTVEIDSNLEAVAEMEPVDPKKCSQCFKIAGFLIKVALKLFETNVNAFEDDDVLQFWVMIHSWQGGYFQTNRFPSEIVSSFYFLTDLCTESLVNVLLHESILKAFHTVDPHRCIAPKQCFGFLKFANSLMKGLPKWKKNELKTLDDFQIVFIVQTIFSLIKSCFVEYFSDYNSMFYEELVTNVSVMVLLLPNNYMEIEKLLLECVMQDKIWLTMFAIDIWCLVLRHSSESTCCSTFNAVVRKIKEVQLGIFQQTPETIFFKILAQRIFRILPNNVKIQELSKNDTTIWKIINTRNVPLSHRFYIEFMISDLYEKSNIIEKEDCPVNDFMIYVENLNIISYTNFNDLQINASRLIPFIVYLWSFDVKDLSQNNNFNKYVIYKLGKITTAVIGEMTEENVLVVINQSKFLLKETLHKLLVCELLQALSRRNFSDYQEKDVFSVLISDMLQILLSDKNSVVVQSALDTFHKFFRCDNYATVVDRVVMASPVINKLINDYSQKRASESKYNLKYFQKICYSEFHHQCSEWPDTNQPLCKKLKVENDVDLIIDTLKSEIEKLTNSVDKNNLNARQIIEIKYVIEKLTVLLN
ncbi:FIGNL1-interacting regulator of recombination and mitosis-like isoform X3 [Tenebrio molitor]